MKILTSAKVPSDECIFVTKSVPFFQTIKSIQVLPEKQMASSTFNSGSQSKHLVHIHHILLLARFIFCDHMKRYQYLRHVCECTTGILVSHRSGNLLSIHQRESNSIESYVILQMYLILLFGYCLHQDSLTIGTEMSLLSDKDEGFENLCINIL